MNYIRRALGALCAYSALTLLIVCIGLMLYVPGAGSTLLYALLIAFVVSFVGTTAEPDHRRTPISYWYPLLAAAVWWVVAVGATQLHHGVWHASGLEKSIRALCVIPVVYFFCKTPPLLMRHVQWGFMAVTLTGAWGLIFPKVVFMDGTNRPNTSEFGLYNTVGFANLVMLFSVLTLASLHWRLTRFARTEAALKILVTLAGLYGVVQSQTRSSLVAIPVFLAIAFLANQRANWRWRAWFAAGAVAILVVFAASDKVQDRVTLAHHEIEECLASPSEDTSVCIRFQLLRAASVMLKENPLFGVGDGHLFIASMKDMGDRGIISPYVAAAWGETHNDLSFVAAAYGLFGLFAFMLLFYGVPAWFFVRHLRLSDQNARTAALMGLLVVMGFFAFGLTEAMYRSMRTVSVYIVLVGLLLALSRPQARTEIRPGS